MPFIDNGIGITVVVALPFVHGDVAPRIQMKNRSFRTAVRIQPQRLHHFIHGMAQFLLFFERDNGLVFVVRYLVLLICGRQSGHAVEFSMQSQGGHGLSGFFEESAALLINQDRGKRGAVGGRDCREDIGMPEGEGGAHVVAHGDAGQIDAVCIDSMRVAHLFNDHVEKTHVVRGFGQTPHFPDIPPARADRFREHRDETGAFGGCAPCVAVCLTRAAESMQPHDHRTRNPFTSFGQIDLPCAFEAVERGRIFAYGRGIHPRRCLCGMFHCRFLRCPDIGVAEKGQQTQGKRNESCFFHQKLLIGFEPSPIKPFRQGYQPGRKHDDGHCRQICIKFWAVSADCKIHVLSLYCAYGYCYISEICT